MNYNLYINQLPHKPYYKLIICDILYFWIPYIPPPLASSVLAAQVKYVYTEHHVRGGIKKLNLHNEGMIMLSQQQSQMSSLNPE